MDDEIKRLHKRVDEIALKADAAYSASESAVGEIMSLKTISKERNDSIYKDLDRMYLQIEKLFRHISDASKAQQTIGITIILLLISGIGVMVWTLLMTR